MPIDFNHTGHRSVLYNSQPHRSLEEARWHALYDDMGHSVEYEPHRFDFYIPDFYVDQHYRDPFYVEVKGHTHHSAELAKYEAKSYSRMADTATSILLVGRAPLLAVTDTRCCDTNYEIAAISEPFHRDGCGSWLWATLPDYRIILLPHCGIAWPDDAEPADREYIIDLWQHTKRKVKNNPYKPGDQLILDIGASIEDPDAEQPATS